ncbi:MAG TPA: LytR C-terminal domain-containing protein [Microcella sp.]|nr:LytR C-terminal domain-containing protein [Microcella sp.]
MPDFPPDRFDEVPAATGRVGAHRAPRTRAAALRLIGVSALVTGLIVAGGLVALAVIDDRLQLDIPALTGPPPDEPAEPAAPEVTPITDPAEASLPEGFTITILDGTDSVGRGPQAQEALDARGWPVGTVTQTAESDITETVVYYATPELEGVARGMVELLGGVADIELSDAFPGAPITIVLGSDYELSTAS